MILVCIQLFHTVLIDSQNYRPRGAVDDLMNYRPRLSADSFDCRLETDVLLPTSFLKGTVFF